MEVYMKINSKILTAAFLGTAFFLNPAFGMGRKDLKKAHEERKKIQDLIGYHSDSDASKSNEADFSTSNQEASFDFEEISPSAFLRDCCNSSPRTPSHRKHPSKKHSHLVLSNSQDLKTLPYTDNTEKAKEFEKTDGESITECELCKKSFKADDLYKNQICINCFQSLPRNASFYKQEEGQNQTEIECKFCKGFAKPNKFYTQGYTICDLCISGIIEWAKEKIQEKQFAEIIASYDKKN